MHTKWILTFHHIQNSKWIKNLPVRATTLKLLENLHDTGFGNAVSDMAPKAQATTKTDTREFSKI